MAESIAQLIVGFTFAGGLAVAAVAAVHDQRTRRLLNKHNAALAAIALIGFSIAAALNGDARPLGRLAFGAAVFAGPWLLANLVAPSSIGFGDVKYSAAIGLYLGWIDPLLGLTAIVFAGMAVLVVVLPKRLLGRTGNDDRDNTLAFGPFLLVGAVIAAVLGLAVG